MAPTKATSSPPDLSPRRAGNPVAKEFGVSRRTIGRRIAESRVAFEPAA
jgi:hypothetical protein